jgi:hypothetical protein
MTRSRVQSTEGKIRIGIDLDACGWRIVILLLKPSSGPHHSCYRDYVTRSHSLSSLTFRY